jgi:hypothetical protein
MKKVLIAVLAVFIAWSLMDYVIHGMILRSAYESTSNLWRPMEEMKTGLMHLTVLVVAFVFVSIYSRFFRERGVGLGVKYGLWFGIGVGISMGYGSYSVMPIPYSMALTWFLGTVLECFVAGVLVGSIVKDDA